MALSKEKTFCKLGLFGSSHIQQFKDEILTSESVKTYKLSYSPKSASAILKVNKTEQVINKIRKKAVELDAVLIMIGGNDIHAHCNPTTIAKNIISIANKFEQNNIEPIIVPILNRTSPRNMLHKSQYNKCRNEINSQLRSHYKTIRQQKVLKINHLALKDDGVHLLESSYAILCKAILHHLDRLTTNSLKTAGSHKNGNIEYIIEYL